MSEPDSSHILQIGMGFFASKTLLSAVELDLFSLLAKGPLTGAEIEPSQRLVTARPAQTDQRPAGREQGQPERHQSGDARRKRQHEPEPGPGRGQEQQPDRQDTRERGPQPLPADGEPGAADRLRQLRLNRFRNGAIIGWRIRQTVGQLISPD